MLLMETTMFVRYIQTSFPWFQTRDRTGWDEYESLLSNPATLFRGRIYLPLSRLREEEKRIDGSTDQRRWRNVQSPVSIFSIMHK